jgi:hypothetical protein
MYEPCPVPMGTDESKMAMLNSGRATMFCECLASGEETQTGRSSTADEPDTDVVSPARLRLYRAIAIEHYLLDADDRRVPVTP